MTWFKVDDRLHAHPKALAISLAALGLWTAAGSWSSDHRTGGVMPDHVVPLLSRGASELADELVAAGLWRRVRGGYQFHDWEDMNPTRQEAIAATKKLSSGGALGNHRRWHVDKGVTKPDCPFCQDEQDSPSGRPSDRVGDARGESPPSPPDPSRPNDYPPNPPPSGGNDHHGQHANCRACGTNRRPPPAPKPDPTADYQRAQMQRAEEGAGHVREVVDEEPDIDQNLAKIHEIRSRQLQPPEAS